MPNNTGNPPRPSLATARAYEAESARMHGFWAVPRATATSQPRPSIRPSDVLPTGRAARILARHAGQLLAVLAPAPQAGV